MHGTGHTGREDLHNSVVVLVEGSAQDKDQLGRGGYARNRSYCVEGDLHKSVVILVEGSAQNRDHLGKGGYARNRSHW